MTIIKKFVNDYFVCRIPLGSSILFRNWFLVKQNSKNRGKIQLGSSINTPKELIGKRIRLKIEVLK